MKALIKAAMLIPKPVRRTLTDNPIFHSLLKKVTGKRLAHLTTPEGQQMAIHPIYHAQLMALPSLSDYEPLERQAIGRLCRPGMVAYDVGANVGIFACYMSALVGETGHIIAFEPESNNSFCLEATIRLNSLNNIQLEKKAVGRSTERAEFDRRGGAFSGRLTDHGRYQATANTSHVDVISLDDLVKQGAPPPNLVKIDVEGNELMVLEGMLAVLKTYHPTLLCEVHSHLGDPSKEVVNLLKKLDYEIFDPKSVAIGNPTQIKDLLGRDWFVGCPRTKCNQLFAA